MNGSIVRTIAVWAGVSCVASLTVLMPKRLTATDPVQVSAIAQPERARPVLAGEGFELSVRVAGQATDQPFAALKPGEPIRLELIAVSKASETIDVKPLVRLMSTSPVSRMSRTPSTPTEVYRTEPTITLAPGETRTLVVETNTVIPQDVQVTVALSQGSQEIWALGLATALR